jgi:16S rRNA (guanine527-N7)-methyltransferase
MSRNDVVKSWPSKARDLKSFARAALEWGLPIAPELLERLGEYAAFVAAYERANLTAERSPGAVLLKHVADGAAGAACLKREFISFSAPEVLDLGAGAGFLGIALKILWPEARVTLLEPLKRRFDFLNLAILRLGLAGTRLVQKPARPKAEPSTVVYDAVLAKAVLPLPELLPLAIPLLRRGGLFAAFQSAPPDSAAPLLRRTLEKSSARLVKSWSYRRPLEEKERAVALFGRRNPAL